jgi:hypothetical protein
MPAQAGNSKAATVTMAAAVNRFVVVSKVMAKLLVG